MSPVDYIIEARDVVKNFGNVRALRGVHLMVQKGEVVVIVGPSGSGKSTLLRCLNALERIDGGSIIIDGIPLDADSRHVYLVRTEVGMVFQSFNLISHRTALQNVELALLFTSVPRAVRTRRAAETLERLGLADRLAHRPADLSGGEQQRVALARALAKQPDMLLADEPTGNLDRDTSADIAQLFGELNRQGLTILLVTHDLELAAAAAHRTLRMSYGRIVAETPGAPEARP